MPSYSRNNHFKRVSGPNNAEYEIKKSYQCVIELGVSYFWDKKPIPGINPRDVLTTYKHAHHCYRKENRLAAERWARATKHLARAFLHEAKISYLEPRSTELPFIDQIILTEEDGLEESLQATLDLLNSVATQVPPGLDELPNAMKRYLSRAQEHLSRVQAPDYLHELLRAERINAAYEYGRVLECMNLAYEAEIHPNIAA